MQNGKKNYRDLIAGIVIILVAVFFYWTTIGTRSFLGTGRGRVAPDTIPKIVAVAMMILGAIIVIQWIIRSRTGKIPEKIVEDDSVDCENMTENEIQKRHLFQKVTMPITLIFLCTYIYLMPRIGFTISTFFFLLFQITLLSIDFSMKSWIKNTIIALIATICIYVIFGCAFALAVPKISAIDLEISSLYRSIFG